MIGYCIYSWCLDRRCSRIFRIIVKVRACSVVYLRRCDVWITYFIVYSSYERTWNTLMAVPIKPVFTAQMISLVWLNCGRCGSGVLVSLSNIANLSYQNFWCKTAQIFSLGSVQSSLYNNTRCPEKGTDSILAVTLTNLSNFSLFKIFGMYYSDILDEWKKSAINACTTVRNDDVQIAELALVCPYFE